MASFVEPNTTPSPAVTPISPISEDHTHETPNFGYNGAEELPLLQPIYVDAVHSTEYRLPRKKRKKFGDEENDEDDEWVLSGEDPYEEDMRMEIEEEEEEAEDEEEEEPLRASSRLRGGATVEKESIPEEPPEVEEPPEPPEFVHSRLQQLRRLWEWASVVHFLENFREHLALPTTCTMLSMEYDLVSNIRPTRKQLQQAYADKEAPTRCLEQVMATLLKHIVPRPNKPTVTVYTWEEKLRNRVKRCQLLYREEPNPFIKKGEDGVREEVSFYKLPIEVKVRLVKRVCESLFELSPELQGAVRQAEKQKRLEDPLLRPRPLGRDRRGCVYWYLGAVLWRERPAAIPPLAYAPPPPSPVPLSVRYRLANRRAAELASSSDSDSDSDSSSSSDSDSEAEEHRGEETGEHHEAGGSAPDPAMGEAAVWEPAAASLEELKALSQTLSDSPHRHEKRLAQRLINEVIPPLEELMEQQEKKRKRLERQQRGGVDWRNIILDASAEGRRGRARKVVRNIKQEEDEMDKMLEALD